MRPELKIASLFIGSTIMLYLIRKKSILTLPVIGKPGFEFRFWVLMYLEALILLWLSWFPQVLDYFH